MFLAASWNYWLCRPVSALIGRPILISGLARSEPYRVSVFGVHYRLAPFSGQADASYESTVGLNWARSCRARRVSEISLTRTPSSGRLNLYSRANTWLFRFPSA